MKKLFFIIFCLLSFAIVVNAEELNIVVEDITISAKSDTITIVDPVLNDNEVSSNITFNELDDYVTYDITIKNNSDNKYKISKVKDNNKNKNIEITYSFSSDYIETDTSSVIKMTLRYKNILKNVESVDLDDLNINIIFDDGKIVLNPQTNDKIVLYILLAVISLIGIILAIKYLKHTKKALLLLILVLPVMIYAKEVFQLHLVFKNIEVIGVFDIFNVAINPNNDDTTETIEIKYGDPVGNLPTPSKEGYNFIGWFDDNNNPISPDTTVTSDLVINARYSIINYSLTYEKDGGNATNPSSYTIEDEIELEDASKDYYNFLGWYDNEEFTGNPITKIEKGTTGDKKLYAKFELINYSINYNLNDGEFNDEPVQSYTVETETFDILIPEKENYRFTGWYEKEDLSGKTTNYIKQGRTGNIELYAGWKQLKDYSGVPLYEVVGDEALNDAKPSLFVDNDNGMDFSKASSIRNGNGKYMIDSTSDDNFPIYYYRGEVIDNNVIFADKCWLILRTTETGGVKLVYNGVVDKDKCTATGVDTFASSQIKYNSSYNRTESIGYTYSGSHTQTGKNFSTLTVGTILANDVVYEKGSYLLKDTYTVDEEFQDNRDKFTEKHHYTCLNNSSSCEKVYYIFMGRDANYYYITLSNGDTVEDVIENRNFDIATSKNSTVKSNIDAFYSNNLASYNKLIEDTVYCNDRSTYTKGGWDKDTSIYEKAMFSSTARVSVTYQPSLTCKNVNDSYTVSTSIGNGGLSYPIGLITADEAAYAGYGWFLDSKNYLNNGHLWWTMSPSLLSANFAYVDVLYSMIDNVRTDYISSSSTLTAGGVRPVISLTNEAIVEGGTGTKNNPYIILVD